MAKNRKRIKDIHYTDPEFIAGYDIDLDDFTALNAKRANFEDYNEYRYSKYLEAIVKCVLAGPKFRNKSPEEYNGMTNQMLYELSFGILRFDASKGSSIYSYAYRIAWTSGIHYYYGVQAERELENKTTDIDSNIGSYEFIQNE